MSRQAHGKRLAHHARHVSLLLAGLAAAAIVLACAATASADSIAYINDGNVWLTTPDGARQFQVTTAGGYSDVTQSDDGTIVALNGVRLHRLARDGAVLADFATPVSDTRPAGSKQFWGPYDPAISPDGTKVAYTYYWLSQTTTPNCFPPKCLVALNEGGTGYTWSDRLTDWKTGDAIGYHSGWRHPSWVDNDMTLLANPTHMPNHDLLLDRISDGGNGKGNMVMAWFSDVVDNPHMSGAEVTRDKRKLAAQTGENDSDLDGLHGPRLPERVEGRQPDRLRRGPLLPLLRSRGRRVRAAVVVARRVADGVPRRRRPADRGRAELRVRVHAGGRHAAAGRADRRRHRARLGPGRRPRAARAGHPAAAAPSHADPRSPARPSISVSVKGATEASPASSWRSRWPARASSPPSPSPGRGRSARPPRT